MESQTLPLPLVRAALRLMPSAALARFVDVIVRRMGRRHPKLFKNLARLEPALVFLDPTDLPHTFALTMGCDPASFYVVQDETEKPAAHISGSLESLIAMLEGRADGDTLFFSRDIQVSGDTSIIVGLRNTLDREEINIFDEVTSVCGPFARPVGIAMTLADQFARRVRERLVA